MKVAVLYNEPLSGRPDSEDVLDELCLVTAALEELRYNFAVFPVDSDYHLTTMCEEVCFLLSQLKKYNPSVVFNLVEELSGFPHYQPVMASLLRIADLPYTGSSFETLLTTTDKITTKALLDARRIPTPAWLQHRVGTQHAASQVPAPWIVKPALEDASVGIDDASVTGDQEELDRILSRMSFAFSHQSLLVEHYVEGREFNISLIEHANGEVETLPVAEIVFSSWPQGKPRIVNYKAKWEPGSYEYIHTVRTFNPADAPLDLLKDLALQCWDLFSLRGYARIDMRMDGQGAVYVLEVNANPCISPDSGFIIAAQKAGYTPEEVARVIMESAVYEYGKSRKAEARCARYL